MSFRLFIDIGLDRRHPSLSLTISCYHFAVKHQRDKDEKKVWQMSGQFLAILVFNEEKRVDVRHDHPPFYIKDLRISNKVLYVTSGRSREWQGVSMPLKLKCITYQKNQK